MDIFFISGAELCHVNSENGKGIAEKLSSASIDKYRRTVRDIENRKSWKTSGTGAMFMGAAVFGSEADTTLAAVSGVTCIGGEVCYSAVIGENSSVQVKQEADDVEGTVLRKNNVGIYEIHSDRDGAMLAASCSDGAALRHIGLIDVGKSDLKIITEGDCVDRNPFFAEGKIIYYDSCGVAYNESGAVVGIGPREIIRLNLLSGDLTELVSGGGYDYFKPKVHNKYLYYIRRPYKQDSGDKTSITDLLLAPFKLLKAIGGWLDFFTRRYAGESLKTGGNNPAKTQQKSEEQLFIEGNMINAEKALNENRKRGEKYPGKAPGSWQLMRRALGTEDEQLVKAGVLDYCICPDSGKIIFSNGRYIMAMENNTEEMICECDLAVSLTTVSDYGKKARA